VKLLIATPKHKNVMIRKQVVSIREFSRLGWGGAVVVCDSIRNVLSISMWHPVNPSLLVLVIPLTALHPGPQVQRAIAMGSGQKCGGRHQR
jgi:hypothetical protein